METDCDMEVLFDLSVDGVEDYLSVVHCDFFLIVQVTIYVHGLEFHMHLKLQSVLPTCIQERHKSGLGTLSSLKQENRTQSLCFLVPQSQQFTIQVPQSGQL